MAQNENTATGDSSNTPSGMVLEFSVSVDSIPPESRQDTLHAWCGRFSRAIRTTDAVIPIEDGDKFRFRLLHTDTERFRGEAATTATILQTIAERPAGYELVQGEYSR